MKLTDIKPRIESIFKDHESARNNDGTLIAYYIAKYHATTKIEDATLFDLKGMKFVPISTIRRTRRIIQNVDKKYPPTDPKVIKARRIKEVEIKDEVRYNNR
jgi:hypothetical protein